MALFAQAAPGVGSAIPIIFPPPMTNLKQFLALTDAQVDQLKQVQQQKQQAEQQIWQQISAKYQELETLLNADAKDPVRIGQLMIEIRTLQKQLPLSPDPYRQQALNVLTPEQRQKLPTLDQAIKLAPAAQEAVSVSLIDSPPARILPAGVPGAEGLSTSVSATWGMPNAAILPAPGNAPVPRLLPLPVGTPRAP